MSELGRSPWKVPSKYGYGEMVQSAGMVVTPLLAGFTIALVGLVVDTSNDGIRHRDLALLVLTAAAAALLAAVQCAYSARQYLVTPDQIAAWWPGLDRIDGLDATSGRTLDVRAEQRAHHALHERWARRFRLAYHAGIVLVLVGLALVLIPPDDISLTRKAAIGLTALAALVELAWIAATVLSIDVVPSYPKELRRARGEIAEIDRQRRAMDARAAEPEQPAQPGAES